jgi:hypothetical protein
MDNLVDLVLGLMWRCWAGVIGAAVLGLGGHRMAGVWGFVILGAIGAVAGEWWRATLRKDKLDERKARVPANAAGAALVVGLVYLSLHFWWIAVLIVALAIVWALFM